MIEQLGTRPSAGFALRLVEDDPRPLSEDEATRRARAAFREAQDAFLLAMEHMGNLPRRLIRPGGMVTWTKLRGLRYDARQAAESINALVDSLDRAIDAVERADRDPR